MEGPDFVLLLEKEESMSAFLMGTSDVANLSCELEGDQSLVSYEDGQYQEFSSDGYDPNFDALFGEEEYREMGINPDEATQAKPGSEQKVLMLAARYAAGLPLWNNSDCYDHGPGENLLQGLLA